MWSSGDDDIEHYDDDDDDVDAVQMWQQLHSMTKEWSLCFN